MTVTDLVETKFANRAFSCIFVQARALPVETFFLFRTFSDIFGQARASGNRVFKEQFSRRAMNFATRGDGRCPSYNYPRRCAPRRLGAQHLTHKHVWSLRNAERILRGMGVLFRARCAIVKRSFGHGLTRMTRIQRNAFPIRVIRVNPWPYLFLVPVRHRHSSLRAQI